MEPGENAPPMHPNCHCATAPYMDREEFDEWLDGYSEHGLTFEEWNQLKSKTNEVSRNLAIRNGNIYGIITEGNTNVPKELQKEIDNSLHRIFREFPKMKSFINKIEFSNELERNEIAQAVINKKLNTILRLNTKIFSNKKVYKNLIDTTDEIFVKKNSLDDYFRHEMTHFLEWNHAIKEDKNKAYERIEQDYYSTNLLKKACQDCGLEYSKSTLKKYICEYATYKSSEAVAEACSGGNSKLCERIIYLVNKEWRD